MRYLVTTEDVFSPFLTDWFEADIHWNDDISMVVYDLKQNTYTLDGLTWTEITVD